MKKFEEFLEMMGIVIRPSKYAWRWIKKPYEFLSEATPLPALGGLALGIVVNYTFDELSTVLWLIPVFTLTYYFTAVLFGIYDYNGSSFALFGIATSFGWHIAPLVYLVILIVDHFHLFEMIQPFL